MSKAVRLSGASSWANEKAYVALTQADRATFAWEFARRQFVRQTATAPASSLLSDNITLLRGGGNPVLPGLCFALPPSGSAMIATVQWSWQYDASVLPIVALTAVDGFDLRALALPVTLLRQGGVEHVLIADGTARLRLAVLEGTLARGPVRLRYPLPIGHRHPHLLALRQLMTLRETGRLMSGFCLPGRRAPRWTMVLRAWDAHCAGLSQRDIACLFWGHERVDADWNGRSDYLRMRVYRMVRTARYLVHDGWPRLLQWSVWQ